MITQGLFELQAPLNLDPPLKLCIVATGVIGLILIGAPGKDLFSQRVRPTMASTNEGVSSL